MDLQVSIYTRNHSSQKGIEEFVSLIQKLFKARGIRTTISPELMQDRANIIIDEFTSSYQNYYIRKFKESNPKTPIVFLLTEFIETRFFCTSFNYFGGFWPTLLAPIYNLYIRSIRKDFPPPTFLCVVQAILVSPIAIPMLGILYPLIKLHDRFPGRRLVRIIGTIRTELVRHAYMHDRYLGCAQMLDVADGFIITHEGIRKPLSDILTQSERPERFVEIFYPVFSVPITPNLIRRLELSIEITGTISSYRRSLLRKILRLSNAHGITAFSHPNYRSFNDVHSSKRLSAFSLHPPQSKNWKYSSPTRLYRALEVNRNIPVITRKFEDHPIEDVCIYYDGLQSILLMLSLYHDYNSIVAFLQPKIDQYNEIANLQNNVLVDKFLRLSKHAS